MADGQQHAYHHYIPGKNCMNIYREEQPKNFTISGCVSKKSYRPKYCGCGCAWRGTIALHPYKSKTIDVEFMCPNGLCSPGRSCVDNACFCNLSCKNPNDIFAELENYYGYPEIVN
nr:WNT1-inducible-signaling pathway protein 1-like [Salvelinus alpinus]